MRLRGSNHTHLIHMCPACSPPVPCSLWHNHKHSPMPPLQRLREAALTSLGLIVIGRPQLMLQNLQLNVSDGILGSGATSAPAHSAGSGDAGSPPRRPLSAQASGILQGLLSGENVVKVYTSVLSEPDVSMAVKGRVLTNLVELLRWVCGRQTPLLLLLLQSILSVLPGASMCRSTTAENITVAHAQGMPPQPASVLLALQVIQQSAIRQVDCLVCGQSAPGATLCMRVCRSTGLRRRL